MGYRWKIGNGRKVKFQEDNGWDLLALPFISGGFLCAGQRKNGVVSDLWDGVSLKCTFRRTFDTSLMALWEEVTKLVSAINFSSE